MEKTASINLRVKPDARQKEEEVLTGIDVTQKIAEEIHEKLDRGYQNAMSGRTRDVK